MLTQSKPTLYATGYSNRKLDAWVRMVKKHGVEILVDIRTLGQSENTAKRPECSKENLMKVLPELGIGYHMIPKLGGFRHEADHGFTYKTSPNQALSKRSGNGFTTEAHREFADYMYANPEFLEGIDELLALADQFMIAYFCCEGWERRCHRNLLSDYLTAFDLATVYHIKSGIRADRHERLNLGVIQGNKLVYPA